MRGLIALFCLLTLLAGSNGMAQVKKDQDKEKEKEKTALPKDLVPALLEALKDADPEVRLHAQLALANLGADALPALIEVLDKGDSDQRIMAAKMLANLGTLGQRLQEAVPALLKALKDKEPNVRRAAAFALSQIVSPSEPAEKLPPVPPKPQG